MKLSNALLATSVIVLAFWSIAVFQPRAETKTVPIAQKEPTAKQTTKISSFGPVNIVGVTQTIQLDKVSEVWMDFHNNSVLHDQLSDYPDKVYVYYRDFSHDYQTATVTIGYATDVLKQVKPSTKIAKQAVKPLLTKASYSNTELTNIWQQIDYRQTPKALIEVHYLDKKGTTTASEVLLVK